MCCEGGVATQEHTQFIHSCQVLFQQDRNSHYWYFLSSSEKSVLAGLHKKPKRKVKQARWLGKHWEEHVHAHTLWARVCKSMGGCLFFHRIVKVEWKGTAHAPLPGLDPVARALHTSAEKCVSLLELNQMKAALPGSSFASGPCVWKSQPCCFSMGLISGLRRIG